MTDPRPNSRLAHALWVMAMLALLVGPGLDVAGVVQHLTGAPPRRTPVVVENGRFVLALGDARTPSGDVTPDKATVVAAGGQALRGRSDLARVVRAQPAGAALNLELRRAGEDATRVHLVDLKERRATGPGWWLAWGLGVLVPLVCLAVSAFVTLVRPSDKRAWLVLAVLVSLATLVSGQWTDPYAWPTLLASVHVALLAFAERSFGAWLALFAAAFPERVAFDRRWPALRWILVGPLLAMAALGATMEAGAAYDVAAVAGLTQWVNLVEVPRFWLNFACISAFFVQLAHKANTLGGDAWRRVRLLYVGCTLGFLPGLARILVQTVAGSGRYPWIEAATNTLFTFSFALVPLTFAYVIVVQRALDVRVVLRQGLQYTLVRGGLRLLQVLLTIGVVLLLADAGANQHLNRPRRMILVAFAIWLVVSAGALAQRLHAFVDRRFFREALNTERLLATLSESVRTQVQIGPLLQLVTRTVAQSLHVPRIAAFVEQGGLYVCAHAEGPAPEPRTVFSSEASVLARLRATGKAQHVDAARQSGSERPDLVEERAHLAALGTELLLPLAARGRVLGFLSLGSKRSEEPYSPADVRVLEAVAGQTAIALENARLTEAIAAEVARRERHNRELEIAHEVQEQLFPQNPPRVPGLDYAGHCRPARGVGGDYYDFVELSAGRLGIAIGDVAGKGIPAALLMASLQASLRGQAAFGPADLAQALANVNSLVYDASPANRYATFFYARYDPATRVLEYVNAGHNAPLLLRARTGAVERLDVGGPVIGLMPFASYDQGAVTLTPGDVLVGFTDGISEAMNTAAEEWGEAALEHCLRELPAETGAARMVEHLIAGADAFAAGAPQHDDMTAIVVRVLSATD
jgi:sigma-B regulation protein RsbU (phosphoserine phosphatase)